MRLTPNAGFTPKEVMDYVRSQDHIPEFRAIAEAMESYQWLVDDLIDAGMGRRDWLFDYGYSPGEYIGHLESELRAATTEAETLHQDVEHLSDRVKELKDKFSSYTVRDLLNDATYQVEEAQRRVRDANTARMAQERTLEMVKKERDELRSMLGTWEIMSTPPEKL